MNLTALIAALGTAKTGTDIEAVVFDYTSYTQKERDKSYPMVLWDIDNIEGTKDVRDGSKVITLGCWCINAVDVNDDTDDKPAQWDAIEAYLDAYLANVNDSTTVRVNNMDSMPYAYFGAGLLNVDREMAVRYNVTLQIWC